jgi:hypothetical protein
MLDNLQNMWPKSWYYNNLIESKAKQIKKNW